MTNLKLVSSQTADDVLRMKMFDTIKARSALLMSELCRVAAGAGSDADTRCAVFHFGDALRNAEGTDDTSQILNSDTIAKAIRLGVSDWKEDRDDEFEQAEEMILRGALRMIAARLTGNKTYEAHGSTLLHDGIKAIIEYRTKKREQLHARPKKK